MESPIQKLKEQQKRLAQKIKSDDGTDYDSFVFRHTHIAYCELRGRSRDVIEVPRWDNKADEHYITSIKDEWLVKIRAWRKENEETLCDRD